MLLSFVVGCSFRPGSVRDTGGGDDADADGSDVPLMGCAAWQAHHFDACMIPDASDSADDVSLESANGPYRYDTTTGGGTLVDNGSNPISINSIDYTQTDGTHVALWTMNNFTLGTSAVIYVEGTKPLVIAAWGQITIAGSVDATTYTGYWSGGGSNPAVCSANAAAPGLDGTSGTGGGGGGGFAGDGGKGATGDGNCTGAPGCYRTGGARGTAVPAPTTIRGGCSGAVSGAASGNVAVAGKGGGGLLLAARTMITISGSVLAGGGGGGGDTFGVGTFSVGGGGGGAGGLVALDANDSITVSGILAANGGGGGGGANVDGTSSNGTDGAADTNAAPGGAAGASGTAGGPGSSQANANGTNGVDTTPPPSGGGGGGGGGAGFVLYWTSSFVVSGFSSPNAAPGP